ncbi:hypothetical protein EON65_37760 [archaeon]|nr:MAG: hypothetical protein EON65_37760 [archaeon]
MVLLTDLQVISITKHPPLPPSRTIYQTILPTSDILMLIEEGQHQSQRPLHLTPHPLRSQVPPGYEPVLHGGEGVGSRGGVLGAHCLKPLTPLVVVLRVPCI